MDYTVKFVTTEEETVLTAMKDFLVSINTANLVAATLQQNGYPSIKVSVAHAVAVVAAAVTKSDTKKSDKSVPVATPVVTTTKAKEIPAIAQIAKEEVPRSEATPVLSTKTVAMAMGKIAPITNTATKTTTTTSAATTATTTTKSKGSAADPLASVPVRTSNKSK
jgi:hypothetical protein